MGSGTLTSRDPTLTSVLRGSRALALHLAQGLPSPSLTLRRPDPLGATPASPRVPRRTGNVESEALD